MTVDNLKIKLFADGADKKAMLDLYRNPLIRGFTTNPTLMRKAGIADYEAFARDILSEIRDRPISLEVFADEFDEMERQAHLIRSWGPNVYVKIPVTNTRKEPALDLIHRLSHAGIRLNITAILTLEQVRHVVSALAGGAPSNVSVFAGRIADTGRDPVPMMAKAVECYSSTRHGIDLGEPPRASQHFPGRCHRLPHHHGIPRCLQKSTLVDKDLDEYSLDTVKMFHSDAVNRVQGLRAAPCRI